MSDFSAIACVIIPSPRSSKMYNSLIFFKIHPVYFDIFKENVHVNSQVRFDWTANIKEDRNKRMS